MGNLRSTKRKLSERHVWLAQETERQKILLARKMVEERCKKDAEFAADVLKAVGENLPKEISEAAEKTVAESNAPIVGGDLTHEMVPVQTDGGGEILVHPTELPDSPRDGKSATVDPVDSSILWVDGYPVEKDSGLPCGRVFHNPK
jgi:hypothetical protein